MAPKVLPWAGGALLGVIALAGSRHRAGRVVLAALAAGAGLGVLANWMLRRAEAARKRSERRFRAIFEQAPLGIARIDSFTGRVLEVNASYARIVGRSPEEMATLDWMRITHPDDVQADLDQMARLNAGAITGFRMEKRLLRPGGSIFWVHMTIVPLQVEEPGARRHLAIIEDITERRQAEEDRQRFQGKLMQAQKLDCLGCLAGGLAHDMNNVLGAILGLASANLATQAPGTPGREGLETIVKAAERGGRLVKGLLGFARQAPAASGEVRLNEILQEAVGLLERTTLARIRLNLDLAADLHRMRGDGAALTHAVMNLCVNALDAMPGIGALTLRSRNVEPAWVEIQVQDTGAGMSPEVLSRSLDPFFTTKEVGQGTGLGLTMAYGTVKAHQGHLELHSQPGRGTCVTLRFPACENQAPAPEPTPRLDPPPGLGQLTVLVIDDDELIRSALVGILVALGHRPIMVRCGEEALARLEAGLAPDLAILDMNMPGLGGSGTLPRLRSLRRRLPVLLATGRVDQAALDLAASDRRTVLLPKPFSLEDLRLKIGEARAGPEP